MTDEIFRRIKARQQRGFVDFLNRFKLTAV